MTRHRAMAIAIGLLALLIPATALGGGWAITTIDEVPGELTAGQSYDLTYTILQHGQTPVDGADTSIRITDSEGNVTVFHGAPTGDPGRYEATVVFPAAGAFTWEVTQGFFEPYDLGDVTVAGVSVDTGVAILRWIVPTALVLMIGLIAIQLVGTSRRRANQLSSAS